MTYFPILVMFFEKLILVYFQCSVTCGSGILQRDVECHMGSDRVPSDLCIGQKRPRNTKKCEEKSCLKYTWKFGNWSEVSILSNSLVIPFTARKERSKKVLV